MIKRPFSILILLCSLILVLRSTSFAQSVSSMDLINQAKEHDGKLVTYSGEVIGDIMARGEYAWLNVNDGKNAIGIWIKKELLKDISCTGNYKTKGDSIEITGKFNRACVEHGGDLDIHVQSLAKISSGNSISHSLDQKEINLILCLSAIIAASCLLRLIRKII